MFKSRCQNSFRLTRPDIPPQSFHIPFHNICYCNTNTRKQVSNHMKKLLKAPSSISATPCSVFGFFRASPELRLKIWHVAIPSRLNLGNISLFLSR
jgi:hypothetical protein